MSHSVRHRSGPVLSHDSRRRAASRLAQTGAHTLGLLSGAAGRQVQDERVRSELVDLLDRHAQANQGQDQQVRVQRWRSDSGGASQERRRLRGRRELSVHAILHGRRRTTQQDSRRKFRARNSLCLLLLR